MKRVLSIVLIAMLCLAVLPVFAQAESGVSMVIVNCNSWVSLREVCDTSATRLAKVPKGATVTNCVLAENDFYCCTYNGKTGYILACFLQAKSSSKGVALVNQYVVGCNEWVSLRKTKSTSSARLAKVELGKKVTNCVQYGSWVKCSYNGKTGYIMAKYLSDTPDDSSSTVITGETLGDCKVINCVSWVSLRKSMSTYATRLTTVKKGATVTNCTRYGAWVECTYNGKTGYILAKYLRELTLAD